MDLRTSIVKRSSRTKSVKMKGGRTKEYAVKGGFFFRIHYTKQPTGKPATIENGPFLLKSEAKDAMQRRINEITAKAGRGQERDKRNMTFLEFGKYCLEHGIYAAGAIKSRRSMQVNINNLGNYFNAFKIKEISRESLREYKHKRLQQYAPTKKGDPKRHISQSTVNRELGEVPKNDDIAKFLDIDPKEVTKRNNRLRYNFDTSDGHPHTTEPGTNQ